MMELTELQREVVERVRAAMHAKQGQGGPSRGELAARAAHDEGITYVEAGERFGVCIATISQHWRRLYPNERRSGGRPRTARPLKIDRSYRALQAALREVCELWERLGSEEWNADQHAIANARITELRRLTEGA